MDQDRIKGTARDFAGRAEGAIGNVSGSGDLKQKGAVEEIKGKAQDLYGKAKDTASDAINKASESGAVEQLSGKAQELYGQAKDVASDAVSRASELATDTLERGRRQFPEAGRHYDEGTQVVRQQISESPILAILMAAVVGYLVALVFHGGSNSR